MQHSPKRHLSSVNCVHGRSPVPMSPEDTCLYNFAETLPIEITLKIFTELDTLSLCNASQTCKKWHDIIEGCQQLWKNQCLTVRAICQREVDRDLQDGLSWKLILHRNYGRSSHKRNWLRGCYTNVCSPDELLDKKMCPLDVETWGEILEVELAR